MGEVAHAADRDHQDKVGWGHNSVGLHMDMVYMTWEGAWGAAFLEYLRRMRAIEGS